MISIIFFPLKFNSFVPSIETYHLQLGTIQIMIFVQLVILIKKLWSFKNLEKSRKWDWTWILIAFNLVTSLVFIWKKVEEFEKIKK